uniref:Uncharacterized protein n=1 Tax=Acrobeloides nanus TaxID=290746 RepID=A0A914ELB9_9BILA
MSCRITRKILKDAQDVSQYTGKKEIETEHAIFAMNVFDEKFHPIVDRQRLIEMAMETNNQPLPTSQNFGMRLPNARFSLTQPNYQVPSRQIQKLSPKRVDNYSMAESSMDTSYEIRPVQIIEEYD